MTAPDPVAVAVEAALTPPLAEAAAEVDAWVRGMARCNSRGWDFTLVGPAPDYLRVRLRAVRVLTEHAYATGPACDGKSCEQGGAAHCHKCAEVETDKLLTERDELRKQVATAEAERDRQSQLKEIAQGQVGSVRLLADQIRRYVEWFDTADTAAHPEIINALRYHTTQLARLLGPKGPPTAVDAAGDVTGRQAGILGS